MDLIPDGDGATLRVRSSIISSLYTDEEYRYQDRILALVALALWSIEDGPEPPGWAQEKEKPMPEERIPTSEKLAQALEQAGAPTAMIEKARSGGYDDFRGESATPIADLIEEAESAGLADIAARARAGEFDAQSWEADAWSRTPEGMDAMKLLGLL